LRATPLRGDSSPIGGHCVLEEFAVFGNFHGAQVGADQLYAVAVEHAASASATPRLSASLPADGGQ
jgi:hypothetical protein